MRLPEEVLLMILVIGLYLYDSAKLLYFNEGVLIPVGKAWKVKFGLRELRIGGKELFIPAPWLLHRPMFRLCWRYDSTAAEFCLENWQAKTNVLTMLPIFVWGIALALFLLLPLGFFTKMGYGMLYLAMAILYLNIVCLMIYIWRHRVHLNQSNKQVGKLAFEYLTCPPFALNVIRTMSSNQNIGEDLVTVARNLQDSDRWAETRRELTLRLDEEIEITEEGTDRIASLHSLRLRLGQ
jgi:hypothetical protein